MQEGGRRKRTSEDVAEGQRVCAELIGWTLLGVVVSGFAFWVTDYEIGKILLSGGMLINWTGVAMSLWLAHRRGEQRGDW